MFCSPTKQYRDLLRHITAVPTLTASKIFDQTVHHMPGGTADNILSLFHGQHNLQIAMYEAFQISVLQSALMLFYSAPCAT